MIRVKYPLALFGGVVMGAILVIQDSSDKTLLLAALFLMAFSIEYLGRTK